VHLLEVLIAVTLLATVLASLPPAFTAAVRANLAAADTTWTVTLAAQKMEELRSGPFPISDSGQSFDLLDQRGRTVSGPGSAAYVRAWQVEPAPWAPEETVVITVVVSPYRYSANAVGQAIPGAARLVTLRTKKAR
jgi:Tfp pilus assembly protein PilV